VVAAGFPRLRAPGRLSASRGWTVGTAEGDAGAAEEGAGTAERSAAAESAGARQPRERLDRHVAAAYGLPRNQVQQWIRAGRVRLNGRPAKAAEMVAAGDRIDCEPPAPRPETMVPEPGELAVLYEDAGMVVLDKPAGLAVHPGAGRATGTLAHQLLARYPEMAGVGGPGRPGIVHRLDQGTSGVMVAARTAAAYQRLSRAFASRAVAKRYLAIVYGTPRPAAGVVDAPIGRHRERRKEMTVRADGRPARTAYRTLAARCGIALLELDLATGRTHQIRVHLKSLGHPLAGDPVYGEARWRGLPRPAQAPLRDFPRPALHAWRLALPAPPEGGAGGAAGLGWLRFEAPVPQDLEQLWQAVTGGRLPPLPPTWD
jgi:23S rRNA pseudouridine1911/1915/1917 synthase